jgi:hypothetical protein
MPFVHGKSAAFKLDNAGGTLVDYSTYLEEISMPRSIETAETTTFGSNAKTFITGLSEATISLSGKFDVAADATLAAVLGQTATLTFEYGPAGSSVGAVRYTGECIMTSYEVGASVGDAVTASVELQVTGAITRNTF